MKQHRRILVFLLVLISLLSRVYCPVPPYIHKLPLTLTSNYVYEAELFIGSDEQNVTVLVDTGSGTLAVFCNLCQQGCEVNQQFIIQTSTTFQNVTCSNIQEIQNVSDKSPSLYSCDITCQNLGMNVAYQCKGQLNYGSSSLPSYLDYYLIRDSISTEKNGYSVFSSFGCIYRESNFDSGIWGLSIKPSNEFLQQIHTLDLKQNYVSAMQIFTICTSDGSAVMNIGGIDTTTHISDGYVLTVDPQRTLWWDINPGDIGKIFYKSDNTIIRYQGESFGDLGIILDSGTDFIIFPSSLINRISTIVLNLCSKSTACTIKKSYEIFDTVLHLQNHVDFFNGQIISLEIGGKILQTPLSNYFWNLGQNSWALALVSKQQFNFPMSILGSIWMNNFDIAFDRANYRITIYEITSCPLNGRNLQANDDDDNDYDFPGVRGDRIDGDSVMTKLKMKHQKNIKSMEEWLNN